MSTTSSLPRSACRSRWHASSVSGLLRAVERPVGAAVPGGRWSRRTASPQRISCGSTAECSPWAARIAGRIPRTEKAPSRRWRSRPSRSARYAVSNAEFSVFVAGRGLRHRRGALRVVVRLRGPAPRRLPAYAGRRAGALVEESRGGRLEASRGAALVHRRARRPPRRPRLLDGCGRVLRLGRGKASDGGRMGARRPRRARRKGVSLGRRA